MFFLARRHPAHRHSSSVGGDLSFLSYVQQYLVCISSVVTDYDKELVVVHRNAVRTRNPLGAIHE